MSLASFEERIELVEFAAQSIADLVAEREDDRVDYPVQGEVALLAPAHDPASQQDPEMLRDVLLRGAGRLLKVADARLALAKDLKQLDPHRLAQHPEALSNPLHQRVGERPRNPFL